MRGCDVRRLGTGTGGGPCSFTRRLPSIHQPDEVDGSQRCRLRPRLGTTLRQEPDFAGDARARQGDSGPGGGLFKDLAAY
jgi:hypothetical protein